MNLANMIIALQEQLIDQEQEIASLKQQQKNILAAMKYLEDQISELKMRLAPPTMPSYAGIPEPSTGTSPWWASPMTISSSSVTSYDAADSIRASMYVDKVTL